MNEGRRVTWTISSLGEPASEIRCPHCGGAIAISQGQVDISLWCGDPTPTTCHGCGNVVTLRLAFFEVASAEPANGDDKTVHFEAFARALQLCIQSLAPEDVELRKAVGDVAQKFLARAEADDANGRPR